MDVLHFSHDGAFSGLDAAWNIHQAISERRAFIKHSEKRGEGGGRMEGGGEGMTGLYERETVCVHAHV